MYKTIFILFLTLSLNASNPKPYSVLGDLIYNNANNIKNLKYINSYKLNKSKIREYIKEVNNTREYGFDLQKGINNKDKKIYLNKLRKLAKMNDQYFRDAKNAFNISIKKNDYMLFGDVINSGLIDIETNKETILNYYYKNSDKIEKKGILKNILDEDAKQKALREAMRKRYKTKKQLELERIKRIRENDKLAKLKIEEELKKDLKQKKIEIRKNQEKELSR